MRAKLFAALLALPLGGCLTAGTASRLSDAYTIVTTTQVPARDVIAAINGFDILNLGVYGYAKYCQQHMKTSVCSASNRRVVIKYSRLGMSTRDQLEAIIDAGNPMVPLDMFNALENAVTQLNLSPVPQFVPVNADAPGGPVIQQ